MAATILEQILFVEDEATRLETWLACAESDDMEDHLRRRAHVARETMRTLDFVMRHRNEIAKIGKKS